MNFLITAGGVPKFWGPWPRSPNIVLPWTKDYSIDYKPVPHSTAQCPLHRPFPFVWALFMLRLLEKLFSLALRNLVDFLSFFFSCGDCRTNSWKRDKHGKKFLFFFFRNNFTQTCPYLYQKEFSVPIIISKEAQTQKSFLSAYHLISLVIHVHEQDPNSLLCLNLGKG